MLAPTRARRKSGGEATQRHENRHRQVRTLAHRTRNVAKFRQLARPSCAAIPDRKSVWELQKTLAIAKKPGFLPIWAWRRLRLSLHFACRKLFLRHPSIEHPRIFIMKTKKAAKSKAAPKAVAKPAAPKMIKEALSKSGLQAHLAEASGVAAKDVRAVLAALEGAVAGSISKKGAGSFTLPGLLKITAISVPAKPKRKGINPFTKQEQWFAAKPASTKVKVRPLKKLKDAAA
jgi:nucleoid DNA-binding protein